MRPWSPEDPFLYRVEVLLVRDSTVLDSMCDRFGMRQFEVGDGGGTTAQRPAVFRSRTG